MDAKYLAEIKAREQAATPGPWVVRENKSFGVQSENKNIACCFRQENENFIAHARTDIPALLAEVERLNIILQDERKEHAEEYARLRSTYLDAAAAKDQQTATLKKALDLAVMDLVKLKKFGTDVDYSVFEHGCDYFIQQALEQEGKK